ncbi:hypothetical protein HanRHA438_Chr01g0013021 [Helianthus annuus]|nr:hypothetical protein HanIR_Chr01g0014081 [Helianthus annuus]KAJ0947244.1 hypothetical protein HanRHA438_Chr01g0013021 [Helianthus annuus]
MCATKASISMRVTPPSSTDCLTSSPIFLALFLISLPSSESINILIASSITEDITTSPSRPQSPTFTPIFKTSVISVAFLGCSECIGQAAIGTPIVMLSMLEFQPQ